MTQAFRSPSSAAELATPEFASAGPLRIAFDAPAGPLRDLIASTLWLYDVPWTYTPMRHVDLVCMPDDGRGPAATGSYLVAAQMLVDATAAGLRATTIHGGVLTGVFAPDGEQWSLQVDPEIVAGGFWSDIEDMLSLVVTTGWRRAGFVPLHAGGLTDGRSGVLVCAGGGGGKTTFTLAMARRGWQVLGDDKLLLTMGPRPGQVLAVKQMLNVDPAVARWFPEVGDLTVLPRYSSSTVKRRVALRSLWPAAPAASMSATHLLVIDRRPGAGGIAVAPIGQADAISALLHQSVIPLEPRVATPIVRALATLGQHLAAFRVTVGDDAYSDPDALAVVNNAVQ